MSDDNYIRLVKLAREAKRSVATAKKTIALFNESMVMNANPESKEMMKEIVALHDRAMKGNVTTDEVNEYIEKLTKKANDFN